ncbi:unnamed protein product [Cyprideis torosa]|uniref:Uncharacterized protein n=1 Tax=Cyprideis torosa TaxID=163714 RepID=A0A7R8X380_9CRUS|nr:unnamed protein product [Cyprideis torosa]CAG0911211.1 unnamed protein product [Cyprideis torosa]
MILVANGTPVLVGRMMGERLDSPVDLGMTLADGNRLFGPSKTWRGFLSAILVTTLVGMIGGHSPDIGLAVGLMSMIGDLISSFVKRRLSLNPSEMFTGMDQIPESLLPALALKTVLDLSWLDVVCVVGLFVLLNRLLSIALFKLNIRSHPH